MPWSPGHGDRAANAIVNSIKHGENGRLAAGRNRATGAIRAEGDANHPFPPYPPTSSAVTMEITWGCVNRSEIRLVRQSACV
jgi:hypothetical protein